MVGWKRGNEKPGHFLRIYLVLELLLFLDALHDLLLLQLVDFLDLASEGLQSRSVSLVLNRSNRTFRGRCDALLDQSVVLLLKGEQFLSLMDFKLPDVY